MNLDSPLLGELDTHLWEFATVTPDTFNAWYGSNDLADRDSP